VATRPLGWEKKIKENGGIKMQISDDAEEILEELWTVIVEKKEDVTLKSLGIEKDDENINELIELGLIKLKKDDISLTSSGREEARGTIRRHRLAERLLADILDTKETHIEEMSCKMEHALYKGVDESICTILGHPRVCPHGAPIPKGRCCRKAGWKAERVVYPLSELDVEQVGKIAYIHSQEPEKLQKLMAMGVMPGMTITLITRFPSFVFQLGQTQIAIDKEIAGDIYVRLIN
jgi:DtxR family Mn-dependent transcriptional regulator